MQPNTNIQQDKIIVICAPSGSGKTTIYNQLLIDFPILSKSISATTRLLRGKEKDGVDYYSLTIEEFKSKIENNDFIEWEKFYKDKNGDKYYGTLKSEIQRINALGKIPLLDIDVKGAQLIKKIYGDNALLVFVKAPPEKIKERLIARGTDEPEQIQIRLDRLPEELTYEDRCDKVVENIDLQKAMIDARKIVEDFLSLV